MTRAEEIEHLDKIWGPGCGEVILKTLDLLNDLEKKLEKAMNEADQ
ncbi:MAG: hypothetical protein ACYTDW_01395 [Planctomycetota bacterium]|jgi:hypothetical protein